MQRAITCLHPPTADTLQTFAELPFPARAACNLQKDTSGGGLTGLASDLPADLPLAQLHGLTSNLFAGVSLVACSGALPQDLDAALADFATEYRRPGNGPQPTLADLAPLGRHNDFYFLDQVFALLTLCTQNMLIEKRLRHNLSAVYFSMSEIRFAESDSKDNNPTKSPQEMHLHAKPRYLDVVRQNDEKNKHEFFDLYEMRPSKHSSAQDRQQRDAAVWLPRLCGDVAVVRDDGLGTFLLCRSGIPHLTSELVHALRADLPADTTCETFASSKEVWFLAGVARRNRLHLLARLADELGVDIARQRDTLVHDEWPEDVRDMAVEAHGVVLEDLVVDAARGRVLHCKGCVPLRAGMPAVPVWLGPVQGCVLWEAPPHVRGMPEPLLPCVPLRKRSVAAVGLAAAAGQAKAPLHLRDLKHLVAYEQVVLEDEQVAFLCLIVGVFV